VLHRATSVLVRPCVDRKFAGLAEGLVAPRYLALVGSLPRVNVQVVFQVLAEGEPLPTEFAGKLAARVVGLHMPPQTIFVGILFSAVGHIAAVWFFFEVVIY
jgi:hypothetical protein